MAIDSGKRLITNTDELMKDVIQSVMPVSVQLSFLVGYFYFSGFEELCKTISHDMPLRILVGMEAEASIAGNLREAAVRRFPMDKDRFSFASSNEESRKAWYSSIIELANNTELFDSPERQEAWKLFLVKIKNGSLLIRKTVEPNHAKVYIFRFKDEIRSSLGLPGQVITGSSNLTWSGLTNRHEVNVRLHDPADFEAAVDLFETLWVQSIPLVDDTTKDEFFTVIKGSWMEQLPSPYLMYLRVLEEVFSLRDEPLMLPAQITNERYFSTTYQTDAIKRGLAVIRRHGGCIIADVVGLGKSVIAASIAHNLGLRVLVVCPPHLENGWNDYLLDFSVAGEVWSSGKLDRALEASRRCPGEKVIIVDEAHRYRNELTRDYGLLHQLCAGNKVMLLTATPFNNRPQDIFSLVKLFQIPACATIQTTENLSADIARLVTAYKRLKKTDGVIDDTGSEELKRIAAEIRRILSPLVIRRTRLDLLAIDAYRKDLEAKGIEFAAVSDPVELDYELGVLSALYTDTLEALNGSTGFIGARYKPLAYLKESGVKQYLPEFSGEENLLEMGQQNLARFMKRLLVRRFESSVKAFRLTLGSLLDSSRNILAWYERFEKVPLYKKGIIPDAQELEGRLGDTLEGLFEDEAALAIELSGDIDRGLLLIDRKDLKDSFEADLRSDISLLEELAAKWQGVERAQDPKFTAFDTLLKEARRRDPSRKIVVFSEFSDTVAYVGEGLKEAGLRVFLYSSSLSSPKEKETIRRNFDAGCPAPLDDFDIIVATDAISEGINLHRAGAIYNYDIPYNPTRVIQRVGRINRINQKVFDTLHIFNFFPTATGESETGIRGITSFKMAMIQAVLGSDTRILSGDEDLGSWFAAEFKAANSEDESLSWDTEFLNALEEARRDRPEALLAARNIARRARVARKSMAAAPSAGPSVLVFARKGSDCAFSIASQGSHGIESRALGPEEALPLFKAAVDERSSKVDEAFNVLYHRARASLDEELASPASSKLVNEVADRLRYLSTRTTAMGATTELLYLKKLSHVCERLDALPDGILRSLKALPLDSPQAALGDMQELAPLWYLDALVSKADELEKTPHQLILSEELTGD